MFILWAAYDPNIPQTTYHSRWRKSRTPINSKEQISVGQRIVIAEDVICFFLQFKVLWKYLRDLCHCRHTPNLPGPWKQLSLVKSWGDMLEKWSERTETKYDTQINSKSDKNPWHPKQRLLPRTWNKAKKNNPKSTSWTKLVQAAMFSN